MKRFPSPGALTGGLLTLALLPVFWPSGALAQEVEACTEEATDLIAGQTTVVGDVNVCNDATTLTVTYEPTSPWCLLETDLHVATVPDPPADPDANIPQNRPGNPKPDEFAYGDEYGGCLDGPDTFEIMLEDIGVSPGDTVVVAANARVLNMVTGAEEGAWGDGTRFVEPGNWAMYFTYVVEVQSCDQPGGFCTVFVTSLTFTGNLVAEAISLTDETPTDGLAAGDAICQALAESDGSDAAPGTYKAWLSVIGGDSPRTRFTRATVPYVRVDGEKVAEGWDDLTSGQPNDLLAAPINVSENVRIFNAVVVWTATGTTGNPGAFVGTGDCGGWFSTAGLAVTGNSAATDARWTLVGFSECSSDRRLYCFQQ